MLFEKKCGTEVGDERATREFSIELHNEAASCYPFTRNEELQNNKSIVVLYYVSWAA